jgi:hypothetical protein
MAPSIDGGDNGGTSDQTMPPTMAGTIAGSTAAPTAKSSTAAPTAASTTSSTMTGTTSSTTTVASAPPTPGATVVSPFLTQAPTASQSAAARFLQDNMTAMDDDEVMTNNTMDDDDNMTLPDPYIFATCVTVDCGGNCNGTCSLGCDVSGEQCAFCEGGAGQPTMSPTGGGDGSIEELSSGSGRMMGYLTIVVVAVSILI